MKILCVCLSFIISLSVLSVVTLNRNMKSIVSVSAENCNSAVIILDAGHGGEDGGAVAGDGTVEKNINLSITLKISSLFEVLGVNYIPVRTQDISIGDNSLDTIRKRKTSDIKARKALIDNTENSVLLSIHQNKYEQSRYSGTQVFYSENVASSDTLAQIIQDTVTQHLQPDNTRQIKPSTNSIYLLYEAKRPSVLVECGFMSNPQELVKLKDDIYRSQLALCITAGILNYLKTEREV